MDRTINRFFAICDVGRKLEDKNRITNHIIENFAVRNSVAQTNCRLNWAWPKSPNERDSMHSASPEVEEFGELPEGYPSHSHSRKLPSINESVL